MDKQGLIELTNKVYKLTLLFPKKEPLRYKMREIADDILAGNSLKKNLETMKSYFQVAKYQNWVSYFDILKIEQEYDEIEFRVAEARPRQVCRGRASANSANLDSRKERILKVLKEKDRIQVGEINKILPDVTKRTLRRDFDKLLKQGLVERVGESNKTFYKLK